VLNAVVYEMGKPVAKLTYLVESNVVAVK